MKGDERLRRLHWRCRRGMLELDLALRQALDRNYDELTEPERSALERLFETPDPELLTYLQGESEPRDNELRILVRKIR